MNDNVNYTVVGAFVLVLGAALVAAVLWLAVGTGSQKHFERYQTIVVESVAGLNIDAPVKYLGVNVGKVSEIAIDPANSSQVRLRFLIERGTPIKQDTEAVLKSQGLTGIAYVELSGGSADSPPLVSRADGEIPVITSKPSLSTRLESVLTTVLASVDRTSSNLAAVFDDENRAALKQTLADAAAVAQVLAAHKQALGSGIADASRLARTTSRASEQIEPTLDRIRAAANAIDNMAQVAAVASERAGSSVDAAAGSVQRLGTDTLPVLEQLLAELNQLAASLQRLSEQAARSPSSVLVGGPKPVAGPGEKAP